MGQIQCVECALKGRRRAAGVGNDAVIQAVFGWMGGRHLTVVHAAIVGDDTIPLVTIGMQPLKTKENELNET